MDITVEAELKAEFFDIFSADIGVSVTTGYDWTHATDSTKSEQTTITVEAEAPPGKYLVFINELEMFNYSNRVGIENRTSCWPM